MLFKVVFLVYVIGFVRAECTLENLYKDSHTQRMVRNRVTHYFEYKFAEVIKDSLDKAKYLVLPAQHFKKDIKKLFVKYRRNFNNYEDLELILKGLNYLSFPVFKANKENIEKFGSEINAEKWIQTKCVP